MNDYPRCLTDEQLDRLAKIFPDTAADLRCWKRCIEIGEMFDKIKEFNERRNRKIKAKNGSWQSSNWFATISSRRH